MRIFIFLFILFTSVTTVYADESGDVQALLQKMQAAAKKENYAGTFVLQRDGQLSASHILHRYESGDESEKIETMDGRRREYVRHNDDALNYQPDIKTRRSEKRQVQDMFPSLLAFNNASLGEHYQLKLGQTLRVAGVDCQMIVILPKDQYRFGYRLCAAIPSNLLLLAQTTGLNNLILEQIAFTTLTLGPVDDASLKSNYSDISGWKTVHDAVVVATESGWRVNALPAGFKKIREVRWPMHGNTVSSSSKNANDWQDVVQLVYSDSLATISVFIEPLNNLRHPRILQKGATTISAFQFGDFWITLVGEVPVAAIKLLSDSIEYKPK